MKIEIPITRHDTDLNKSVNHCDHVTTQANKPTKALFALRQQTVYKS